MIHRWVLEALGDEIALGQVGPDGLLPIPLFGQAMERVRLAKFPDVSRDEGSALVGALLANNYLDSEHGQMIDHAIEVLPLARALESVVMPMAERLRKAAEFDFQSTGAGGRIVIRGALVVSPHTMRGFFQAIVARIPGEHLVSIAEQTEGQLVLSVTPR